MIVAATASACQNSCQKICTRMAAYARECGYEVTSAELQTCREQQEGDASADDRAICRQLGDADDIRASLTCEDLAPYWRVQSIDTDSSPEGDTAW